jgi:DNA primase catalytic core
MPSLVDVVSQDVELKRAGREYVGLCPFHAEKTPSFAVNEEKGFYHCYSCGAGGDLISFLRKKRGLSFREAARIAGKDLDEQDQEYARRKQEAREKILRSFFQWRHDKQQVLTELHDEIAIAETAYRATVRAPELWTDEEKVYQETYLGDLYFVLTLAQQDNDLLTDDREAWDEWSRRTQ